MFENEVFMTGYKFGWFVCLIGCLIGDALGKAVFM